MEPRQLCKIEGCPNFGRQRSGLCKTHYNSFNANRWYHRNDANKKRAYKHNVKWKKSHKDQYLEAQRRRYLKNKDKLKKE